jgi:hypothetical protein
VRVCVLFVSRPRSPLCLRSPFAVTHTPALCAYRCRPLLRPLWDPGRAAGEAARAGLACVFCCSACPHLPPTDRLGRVLRSHALHKCAPLLQGTPLDDSLARARGHRADRFIRCVCCVVCAEGCGHVTPRSTQQPAAAAIICCVGREWLVGLVCSRLGCVASCAPSCCCFMMCSSSSQCLPHRSGAPSTCAALLSGLPQGGFFPLFLA